MRLVDDENGTLMAAVDDQSRVVGIDCGVALKLN